MGACFDRNSTGGCAALSCLRFLVRNKSFAIGVDRSVYSLPLGFLVACSLRSVDYREGPGWALASLRRRLGSSRGQGHMMCAGAGRLRWEDPPSSAAMATSSAVGLSSGSFHSSGGPQRFERLSASHPQDASHSQDASHPQDTYSRDQSSRQQASGPFLPYAPCQ